MRWTHRPRARPSYSIKTCRRTPPTDCTSRPATRMMKHRLFMTCQKKASKMTRTHPLLYTKEVPKEFKRHSCLIMEPADGQFNTRILDGPPPSPLL